MVQVVQTQNRQHLPEKRGVTSLYRLYIYKAYIWRDYWNMKKRIEIEKWERKELYRFFSQFEVAVFWHYCSD